MGDASTNGKKVLIIDDDKNHVQLLEKRLKAAGYSTIAAADGVDGLKQAIHTRPDLIITDVLLPRMNGFQLVHELKTNPDTSVIPVIMMSAVYVTDEDMSRGFELGAETYVAKADLALRKPLQEQALLDAAASLLTEKQAEAVEIPPRVLVVDDDAEALAMITKRLKPEGFLVETASGGQDALDKINTGPYDIVLLDIKMPDIDGLTVLSRVKERHPGISTVMMTAYGSEEIAVEAMRRGADDYLIKPLEETEPLPTVRVNLEKIRRKREIDETALRLRETTQPESEAKEQLIEELRTSSIALMEQYNKLLSAEEQNRAYAEQLEKMVAERTEDLGKRSKELAMINSVLSVATRSPDLSEMLDITLCELDSFLDAKASAAFVIDQETSRLRMVAQHGVPTEFLRWASRQPGGEGKFAQALDSGQMQFVTDLSESTDYAPLVEAYPDTTRLVVYPMKSTAKIVGLFMNLCSEQCEFAEGDWNILQSIGEEVGVVVENAQLYENLRLAYLSTIRALAEAVDAKDAYTRGHSERVSSFAVATAEKMGFDEEFINNIRYAGFLHDIGKIGTPDAVLLKEGILTAPEMETMRLHPGASHKIIAEAQLPEEVKEMIRHHHEWFDGSGYPDGLKGEEIPVGARILCVADSYEAMTSDRPYRDCMGREEAVAEIKTNIGRQFDGQVVKAFLEIREQVEGQLAEKEKGVS